MQKLQILKIQNKDNQHIFNLNTTSGNYDSVDGTQKRHLYSFLGENIKILSVKDKIRNIVFSVGDVVSTNTGNVPINSMHIVGGHENTTVQFTLLTNIPSANTVLMPNCTKFVPQVDPKPTTEEDLLVKLEKRIIKDYGGRTLKFNVFKRKRSEDFHTFMSLFMERNKEFDTIYSDTSEVQTTKGRRRSMGDIFMICKYYYPSTTLTKVVKYLYGEYQIMTVGGSIFCGTVKKRVFRPDYSKHNHLEYIDEYGNYPKNYEEMLSKINNK